MWSARSGNTSGTQASGSGDSLSAASSASDGAAGGSESVSISPDDSSRAGTIFGNSGDEDLSESSGFGSDVGDDAQQRKPSGDEPSVDERAVAASVQAPQAGATVSKDSPVDVWTARPPAGYVHPAMRANGLSFLLFSWVWPIVLHGRMRQLQLGDLWYLQREDTVQCAYGRFNCTWRRSIAKFHGPQGHKRSSPAVLLMLALLESLGGPFLLSLLVFVPFAASVFSGPLLLQRLIFYLENPQEQVWLGYLWLLLITISFVFGSLSNYHSSLMAVSVGVRMRAALLQAVYRKSLRLSTAARQRESTGRIVNLMSNDCQRVVDLFFRANLGLFAPLQILGCVILLWTQVGVFTLAALLCYMLLLAANTFIARRLMRQRVRMLHYSDERVKLVAEIIQGIKFVKLNAWEKPMARKIHRIRRKEIRQLLRFMSYRALLMFMMNGTPALVTAFTFVCYVGIGGGTLTITRVFTVLATFGVIRMPLMFLPTLVGQATQFVVSLRRLASFLLDSEVGEEVAVSLLLKPKDESESDSAPFVECTSQEICCSVASSGDGGGGERGSECADSRGGSNGGGGSIGDTDELRAEVAARLLLRGTHCTPRGPEGCADGTESDVCVRLTDVGLVWLPATPLRRKSSTWLTALRWLLRRTRNAESKTVVGDAYSAAVREPTLTGITATVRRGELVMVVGETGTGKTTLLAGVLGEVPCVQGSLWVNSAVLRAADDAVDGVVCDDGVCDGVCDGAGVEVGVGVGKIAYVSQVPWIRNATVRSNVCMFEPYDEKWYEEVLSACALQQDLLDFPLGDLTLIGEKGINLSGGQKQRISFARAVYSRAALYLLDDPLSAVDVHVAVHLMQHVVLGILQRQRATVVLVTNQLHFLSHATQVWMIDRHTLAERGTLDELLADEDGAFFALDQFCAGSHARESQAESPLGEPVEHGVVCRTALGPVAGDDRLLEKGVGATGSDSSKRAGVCVGAATGARGNEEERKVGSVGLGVYLRYIHSAGPFLFFFLLCMCQFAAGSARIATDLWLVQWSSAVEQSSGGTAGRQSDDIGYWLGIYAAMAVGQSFLTFVASFLWVLFGAAAAMRLHRRLLRSILAAPMRFFETTPSGRVLNRFSRDTDVVDHILPATWGMVVQAVFATLLNMAVMASATPVLLVGVIPLLFLYGTVQRLYRSCARDLQRLESITRSPIYSNFSETLAGVPTIRAYGLQSRFLATNAQYVDKNHRATLALQAGSAWLTLRLDLIGTCIVFLTILLIVVYRSGVDTALAALVITYCLMLTRLMGYTSRNLTELGVRMTNVERLLHYIRKIPPEESRGSLRRSLRSCVVAVAGAGRRLQHGHSKGVAQTASLHSVIPAALEVVDLTVSYGQHLPPVLRGVTFSVPVGEKIGVVGRTGSGKSTLLASIFRLLVAGTGVVRIDGTDTRTWRLHSLRSRLTVIPQDCVLFSGTIRSNMDPFAAFSDSELWHALELVGMQRALGAAGLSKRVAEGGDNFSVGERQLLSLARAVLRPSPLIVLDEATSSVDVRTDLLIQRTVRSQFYNSTVLTIAHRLHSIMDSDRVLVLADGVVVEYDSPKALLEKERDSEFRRMVEGTGQPNAQHLKDLAFGRISVIDALEKEVEETEDLSKHSE